MGGLLFSSVDFVVVLCFCLFLFVFLRFFRFFYFVLNPLLLTVAVIGPEGAVERGAGSDLARALPRNGAERHHLRVSGCCFLPSRFLLALDLPFTRAVSCN